MPRYKFPFSTFAVVTAFAIAMGFLESSVVIYLRALYYPNGFVFPLTMMPDALVLVEIIRESATIIMLWTIGILAGKTLAGKFAFFLYAFAVWDLFYYIFLKIFLNWPESFMTWDILFLIPITWVGPVITPVIVSLTMILFAILILYSESTHEIVRITLTEWLLLILGSVILILGFVWDYSSFLLEHYKVSRLFSVPWRDLYMLLFSFVPRSFNWWLFWAGEIIIISGIFLFWRRNSR